MTEKYKPHMTGTVFAPRANAEISTGLEKGKHASVMLEAVDPATETNYVIYTHLNGPSKSFVLPRAIFDAAFTPLTPMQAMKLPAGA